ncbi:MFS transporter [Actinomyces sp. zg-332]|uniref:MFS transporter n=1 Tax=Actinomyces sp. zg-332 TaxID=2708340 RepID=UPI00141FC90F|nr:MFS transporter [Actinomyces sp. zg-332]QPK93717.1 MFS transporter [Actinomyces sp. zg-332]
MSNLVSKPVSVSTTLLMVSICISGITTFMLYPLLTINLLKYGLSTKEIGLVLGVLGGIGSILSLLIGFINEKIGSKPVAVFGLLLRSAGMSVFIWENDFLLYILGASIASIGSSSTALALKTELLRRSTNRRLITIRSIAINLGATTGPMIGAALYWKFDFSFIVECSIASYILLAIIISLIHFNPSESSFQKKNQSKLPDNRKNIKINTQSTNKSLIEKKVLYSILGLTAIYWIIYSQWAIIVPILAKEALNEKFGSGFIYSLNAITILILQYPILVHAFKNIRDSFILFTGFVLIMFSSILLLLPISWVIVILFAIIFTFGEMLISPTLDSITAKASAKNRNLTRTFGFTTCICGIASLLGSFLIGLLISIHNYTSDILFLTIPTTCLALILSMFIVRNEVNENELVTN